MYEQQRETLMNQQINMEGTRFTVESIQDTVQTVQALQAANKQMKSTMKTNKELDLSFIDKLQEDLADMAVRTATELVLLRSITYMFLGKHLALARITGWPVTDTCMKTTAARPSMPLLLSAALGFWVWAALYEMQRQQDGSKIASSLENMCWGRPASCWDQLEPAGSNP